MASVAKSISLVITLAGGLINALLTLQLAGSWARCARLTPRASSTRGSLMASRWGLLAAYLMAAAFVSFINPSHVRLYRDCSSADLVFTAFLNVLAALAACEQCELAPLFALLLTLLYSSFGFGSPVSPGEACERALDQAAVVGLVGLLALTVRLHFLLVGAHYSALAADVVYTLVHCPAAANSLLGTSAEVWVRAPGAGAEASYAPASVSAPPSPASPAYAPAYVQSQPEPEREEQPQRGVDLSNRSPSRNPPMYIHHDPHPPPPLSPNDRPHPIVLDLIPATTPQDGLDTISMDAVISHPPRTPPASSLSSHPSSLSSPPSSWTRRANPRSPL
ncbi:hypothetical protein K438DRAFT_1962051 [Mycena galopus ATCC 62051]|nr:hypothetical protein K438DRAFT_1962051 [Mycena galopus ATCC 62051]